MDFTVALLACRHADTRPNIIAACRRPKCCGTSMPPKMVGAQQHMVRAFFSPIGDAIVGSV